MLAKPEALLVGLAVSGGKTVIKKIGEHVSGEKKNIKFEESVQNNALQSEFAKNIETANKNIKKHTRTVSQSPLVHQIARANGIEAVNYFSRR